LSICLKALSPPPASPLEILIPALGQSCLSLRVARLLECDEVFQALQYRCHQIYDVHNFASSQIGIPISIRALRRAFGCARDRVTQARMQRLEPPENRGRHLAIAPEIDQQTLQWIEHNSAKATAMTV
jgi:hypothetical protein